MPESRTTTQRLQLAAANFAGALVLAFIAWKAASWAFDYIGIANQATVRTISVDTTETMTTTSIGSVPIAILLVAGFAALLAIAAIANAGYLAFHRED